jgi:hypothetical protein
MHTPNPMHIKNNIGIRNAKIRTKLLLSVKFDPSFEPREPPILFLYEGSSIIFSCNVQQYCSFREPQQY